MSTQQERITAMANVMIEARRANEDLGELLAASLHAAARQLGGVEDLVVGRPGSWEADIVRRMASTGDYSSGNPEHIAALTPLFVKMGQAKEDGGDVLSQAMGEAVNTLGGLNEFAGVSQWYWDLVNIGCQYSTHPYDEVLPPRGEI